MTGEGRSVNHELLKGTRVTFGEIVLSVATKRRLFELVQLMHDVSINLYPINVSPKHNKRAQTHETQLISWNQARFRTAIRVADVA